MSTRDRLTVAAAVAVALTSSALRPVYEDLGWLLPVLGGVVAVSGASALARLARAPRALQPVVGLLALAAYVALTSAGDTLVYGVLPTTDTALALTELVQGALLEVQQRAAPVPTGPGLVLLAVLGTGAITVVVDLLAVVLRRVAASGLPLLLLFAVPSAVLQGGLGVVPFVLGAAGWLGLLLADGSDRAARWGSPLRSAASQGDPGLGRVGRRIGVAALGVSIVVPALVPGLDGELLIGNGTGPGVGGARSTTTYNPLLSLAGQLRQPRPQTLFTYRSEAGPDYLRLTTLDVFDPDSGWSSSELSADIEDDAVQDGVPVARSLTAPGDEAAVDVDLSGRLGGPWLPIPATPTGIAIDGPWLWDGEAETVFSTRTTVRDVDEPYTVSSLRIRHDLDRLRRSQTVPNEIAEVYAQEPELSEEAQALLDATTEGAPTDFDRVAALQRLFRETDFVYSLRTPPPPPDAPDALTAFLRTRQGFCEQYASAMAALVRGLGMPARVAVGFTSGSPLGDDTFLVTTREAHAWPEVWFQGAGWVRFEPTPRSDDVQVDVPDYSTALPAAETDEEDRPALAPGAAAPLPSTAPTGPGDRAAQDGALAATGTGTDGGLSPWLLAVPAALAALAAPATLAAVRRRRWSRSPDALAAWASVRADAADIGHRWRPADSPRTAAAELQRVRRLPEPAAQALARLALGAERARYARSVDPADGAQLREDARRVRAALLAGATPRARWTARLAPPSTLGWAGHGIGTAVADLLDRLDAAVSAVGARLRHPRRVG